MMLQTASSFALAWATPPPSWMMNEVLRFVMRVWYVWKVCRAAFRGVIDFLTFLFHAPIIYAYRT